MFVAGGWLLAWIIDNPTRAYLWFAADLRVVLPWFLAGFIFLGGAPSSSVFPCLSSRGCGALGRGPPGELRDGFPHIRGVEPELCWTGACRAVPRVRFLLPLSVKGGALVEEPEAPVSGKVG